MTPRYVRESMMEIKLKNNVDTPRNMFKKESSHGRQRLRTTKKLSLRNAGMRIEIMLNLSEISVGRIILSLWKEIWYS